MTDTPHRNQPTADTTSGQHVVERNARVGQGGEVHQTPDSSGPRMTSMHGVPTSDNQNSLRAGARGPLLMEDFHFREKIFHFDHERIPERVVHARGYGAHGYFENYESLSDLTTADLFQRAGEKTETFTRFSTVLGNKGSPDMVRDVRGFATKFYTKQGNWDLVGNNIPVFFIQDAIKFPDIVHAGKPAPDRDFPQAQTAHDNFWDFISLMPESMHMIMWTMSDRAIPRGFRFIEGFGVHSFRMVNAEGVSRYVKFHWRPKLGLQSVLWDEALRINGADPDFHRRDLWDAIEMGDYPEWELGLQVFDDDFADAFAFDILDPTKIIPEEEVPLRMVGRLVLNRMPDNFFNETEQVAFCTQNIVPGLDFTNDPLLQGRNFSYLDTQLKRLGSPNFTQIPINAPRCPVHNFMQDGHMQNRGPKGRANYEPNSWSPGGPRADVEEGFRSYPEEISGVKRKLRPESFADHYSQARQFYLSQTPIEQRHIADALIFELSKIEVERITERVLTHLPIIDPNLAQNVASGLGMDLPDPAIPMIDPIDLPPSDALSILKMQKQSFKGRKMGIVVTDGIDDDVLDALLSGVKAAGAVAALIAARIAGVTTAGGAKLKAHYAAEAAPSALFDAVAVLASVDGVSTLTALHAARSFAADAMAHGKLIGMTGPASALFAAVGVEGRDAGMILLETVSDVDVFVTACAELRYWPRIEG
ncbi:catalase HPII (plasmid) [Gemmobacter aquarius]|uniref:Catalase n=1 Tax=Paragemmobacter aquarius TaxID=2169400 RepID=A0A2S0US39_9RHOB|nr:catalase [Gemmobacter aquarius]AWB50639.1 catalase HPII [Gemmobacter aquarius]